MNSCGRHDDITIPFKTLADYLQRAATTISTGSSETSLVKKLAKKSQHCVWITLLLFVRLALFNNYLALVFFYVFIPFCLCLSLCMWFPFIFIFIFSVHLSKVFFITLLLWLCFHLPECNAHSNQTKTNIIAVNLYPSL